MKENMPFGLKIAIINRAFKKRLDEKASAMGLTFRPISSAIPDQNNTNQP